MLAQPFVKWAGGKQALAQALLAFFPREFHRYWEPFLGGGSVFFALRPGLAVLGDANAWLIATWRAIRDDWQKVAAELAALPNTRADYLRIRARDDTSAARFIYLNKTCFRGLFRVNREGRFNVPYGAYERRTFDPRVLAAVARSLVHAELRAGDFEASLAGVARGDFVYLDPPYWELGGFADFNRYTARTFGPADHERLAARCRALDAAGVRFVLSNSDTEPVRALWRGFTMRAIASRREICLDAAKRSIQELVITNG